MTAVLKLIGNFVTLIIPLIILRYYSHAKLGDSCKISLGTDVVIINTKNMREENIKYLHIKQDHLFKTIPSDIIQRFQNLAVVNLENAGLKVLSSDVLSNFSQLKHVNLSNNLLTALPAKLFRKSSILRDVIIENNEISEIDKDAFVGPGNLVSLSLKKNQIKDLHWETFREFNQLREKLKIIQA